MNDEVNSYTKNRSFIIKIRIVNLTKVMNKKKEMSMTNKKREIRMTKENLMKYIKSPMLICFILAGIINFIIECFGRKSVHNAMGFLKDEPHVFTYNLFLIFVTMSIILITRRRIFFGFIISSIWLAIGITNGVLLSFRVTPFTAVDLLELKAATTIMDKYFTGMQIIYLILGAIVLISLIILIFFIMPKYKGKLNYKRNFLVVLMLIFALYGSTKICLNKGILSRQFGNLAYSYQDYGVPYCYIVTMLDTGIKMPVNYTEKRINQIVNKENNNTTSKIAITESTKVKKPNIIFVQLESFIDPTIIKNLSYSEDPTPTFRRLKKEFSSGYLSVPVIGAGTCNTEFEVITGMNIDFFGPGEYPYKTILKKTTCESMSYNLKNIGYKTHAIHNNDGTFYARNEIFSQLGFDTFTSIEYMENVELNPKGWAKDKDLTREIIKSLDSTIEQDLVYTISVQAHGRYPSTVIDDKQSITVKGIFDKERMCGFEYYVNQIKEVDDFINDLTTALSNYDEDVVLVLYGDHLPGLGIANCDLESESIYKTEYIIWDNFGLEKKDMSLQAYQLSSAVFSRLGIDEGTLTKYHQNNLGTKSYKKNLRLLQYDMLYGRKYVYNGKNPFKGSDLVMGVEEVKINEVLFADNTVVIKGENFTEFSHVLINDKKKDTIYIDSNTLKVEDCSLKTEDIVTIHQSGSDKDTLSTSKEFEYQ